ncbi:MAG: DUF4271 domain-containing protein [Haliscomenobacter sp.]|nr:DUF4271 domain-containing protein [Haliscomenobacter sp.]MBK8879866.1 DUF4271 domain-containing protein [Haliscomenobacter sp.]
MKRILILALGWAIWAGGASAQTVMNPFDLRYRMESDSFPESGFPSADLNNPFELRVWPKDQIATGLPLPSKPIRAKIRVPANPQVQLGQIRLTVTLVILLLLTFLITLFRGILFKAFAGFFNDNLFFQFFREYEGRGLHPSWFLYLLYPVNAGIFAFFALRYFALQINSSLWLELGICLGAVLAALFLKHLVLGLVASIFPVAKEVDRYQFLMQVFGIALGVFLAPVNILLAYGPDTLYKGLVFGTFSVFVLVYAFRSLRGLLIGNKFLIAHRFHFLLYICTVELSPVLIFIKLVFDQSQI